MLAQPAFTDEAARDKAELLDGIFNLFQEREEEPPDEPMDDEATLALLEMAGRKVVRKVNASS